MCSTCSQESDRDFTAYRIILLRHLMLQKGAGTKVSALSPSSSSAKVVVQDFELIGRDGQDDVLV